MIITHEAIAGTLESGDATVRVSPHDSLDVTVTTSVESQYGSTIKQVVSDTLTDLGLQGGIVTVTDKGALDCTLRARVQAAVVRGTDGPVNWAELIGAKK